MNNKRQTAKVNILYERLSRDDLIQGESLSIANQKQILETYAKQNGYEPFLHLTDDGFTETNFNRPGWQAVLAEIEKGNVRSIICKNKDRFGRDYLRVGLYMEMFREQNIRFIAIGDGVDNIREDDDFAPFRDIISDAPIVAYRQAVKSTPRD